MEIEHNQLSFRVWNITEERYLQPVELLPWILCEGDNIDDVGHPEFGVIRIGSLISRKGYRLERY